MRIKNIFLVLSCGLLISCGTTKPYYVEVPPSETDISEQADMLKNIHIGQSKKDLYENLTLPMNHSFDISENGKKYSFIEVKNKKTNITLGLYFEDDLLISVIEGEDSKNLSSCRALFKTDNEYWSKYGMHAHSDWMKTRNVLSEGFNYRTFQPTREKRFGIVGGALEGLVMALELLIYTPGIIISAPSLIFKSDTEAFREKRKEKLMSNTRLIKLNDSKDFLREKLGSADEGEYFNSVKILTYYPSYYYGIQNDVVVWKEYSSILRGHRNVKKFGIKAASEKGCEEFDSYWQSLPKQ
jgi:hypothetical protein